MRLDRDTHLAVLATLDRYAERYGAKDVDGVTDLFADDPDVLLIGTVRMSAGLERTRFDVSSNATSRRRSEPDSSGGGGMSSRRVTLPGLRPTPLFT